MKSSVAAVSQGEAVVVSLLEDAEFDAFEADIYEAALVPERWPMVLDRLGAISGAAGAVLWSRRELSSAWLASPGVQEVMQRYVEEGWIERNTRYESGMAKGFDLVPRFFTEEDFFGNNPFADAPFFADFLIPAGVGWSAGTSVTLPEDLLVLSIERAWADGPVPQDALAALDRLRPHLARSALIAGRLAFEQTRTAVEALAHLGFAAAAISRSGKVLLANQEFETDKTGAWRIGASDRLVLSSETADTLLKDTVARLGTTTGVRSIPIRPIAGAKLEAVMHVVPVRGAAHDLFSRAGAILVVTRSTGAKAGPDLIQALFDLTPTEALIARRLTAGETAEEIATATEKSILTIRTQLKSVLAKTGARRQSELVQLLARLVPPAL
jgi:DNA-binding CsgD family transcriptional regulator